MLLKRAQNILKANADTDARRESYLAKVQALATSWDDLKVALGETVLPSIKGVLDTAGSAMKSVQEFAQNHPAVTGGILKYGGGLLAAAGGLAVARLAWTHLLRFPFQILKTIGFAVTGGLVGIFGATSKLFAGLAGVNTKFGDIMAKGRLSGLAGRLARFAEAMPGLAKAMSAIGKIARLAFGLPGIAASAGYAWVNNTESGSAWWKYIEDYWTYSKHKLQGADRKTLDADIARLRKSNATANGKLYSIAEGVGRYLGLVEDPHQAQMARITKWRDKYSWMHKYRNSADDIPLPIRRPKVDANGNPSDPSYLGLGVGLGWSMPKIGRKGVRQDIREGRAAASGPVPVTIVGEKAKPTPPITIHQTINVTASGLGAIAGAIAGAVGPATASSVGNALADIH
jgi:hypothetical protein